MRRYESYKDSGVEWIGQIPEHWGIIKIKYEAVIQGGYAFKSDLFDEIGNNIVRIGDINNPIDLINCKKSLENNIPNLFKVRGNDILVALSGATVGKMCFIKEDIEAYINQRVARITNNTKWLYYVLNSDFIIKQIELAAAGSAQENISTTTIGSFFITFPSKEQTAIANFLDEKTAMIDKLISDKEKMIELLKEERTAIINQAVTKGINPNVKLKTTGIEWLGDIPEHWEIKKLRYIGYCQNGVSKGAEYFGSGFPFISYGDVYNNEDLSSEIKGLANSSENDRILYSVEEGDVFFTRTSETIEEIGITSTCLKTIPNSTFSGFLIRFRPNNNLLYKGFSQYFFHSEIHRKYFVKEMNLVTRASLSQDLLKNLPIVLPPYDEQKNISYFLKIESCKIRTTIVKIEREIELLKEYKTALINEVVTGKIKVTNS